jgi:DNA-binding CsgD family transcriptional regulator
VKPFSANDSVGLSMPKSVIARLLFLEPLLAHTNRGFLWVKFYPIKTLLSLAEYNISTKTQPTEFMTKLRSDISMSNDADLMSVFNDTNNPLCIKDQNSVYVSANQACATFCGFAKGDEMVGIKDADLRCRAAEMHEVFVQQDQRALDTGSEKNLDIAYYADNKLHALLSSKTRVVDKLNRPLVVCNAIELPITQLSRLIDSLKDMQDTFTGSYHLTMPQTFKDGSMNQMTDKQAECLFYLVRGKTAKEIARILNKSPRTIEEHIENLKNQFGCETKSQLIEYAFYLGFAQMLPPVISSHLID